MYVSKNSYISKYSDVIHEKSISSTHHVGVARARPIHATYGIYVHALERRISCLIGIIARRLVPEQTTIIIGSSRLTSSKEADNQRTTTTKCFSIRHFRAENESRVDRDDVDGNRGVIA
ncbi:AAEL010989-PA [Aedes aegypti]|uniref:AAEL010989-PA n=1 Tax=Aedes aegypti TaxID=7159 RepID=Q16RD7_AEDAE|nr:AAEL010989-PA [Aedes aegypti]